MAEIAAALGRGRNYVSAMKREGFSLIAGRQTLSAAMEWLKEHPDFKQYRINPKPRPQKQFLKNETTPINKDIYDILPQDAKLVVEAIGWASFMRLVAGAKSGHVSIPVIPTPDCAIAKLIGFDTVKKLVKVFPGEVIHVSASWLSVRTPAAVAAMQRAILCGLSFRELAAITGMKEAGLRQLIARAAKQGRAQGHAACAPSKSPKGRGGM